MVGFGFRTNTAFEWKGAQFRIERLQPNGAVLLERQDNGELSIVTREALLSAYGSGDISLGRDDQELSSSVVPAYRRPLEDLSEAARAEARRRQQYLCFILDRGKPVFTQAYMAPLIKEAGEIIGDKKLPSVISIYRWVRRYRSSGDSRSLIPRHDLRGSNKARQGDRLLQLVAESIEEAFAASPLATVPTIYTRVLAKVDDENRCTLGGKPLKAPSLRTVYRMLAKAEVYEMVRLREGKAAADKRHLIVKMGIRTSNILERVEIDHTPLDYFLIDERTWLPLGRPTLTVVIDHFSRMLLGYFLSFGDPSAAAVIGALRHAILPKSPTAEAIPDLKVEHRWPCYGTPDLIAVDNGLEFHGKDLENVAFDLGIQILYCPKHQPRFKGVVERYQKTINYSFSNQMPGASFARLHLRGDYDPQKHALMTLAEFKHLFEKWVVDVYAQTLHRGIGVTPWAKWQEGLQRREPELPGSLSAFKRRIGLSEERSLRQEGILLLGIRYNSNALAPILRRYGEGVRVRVLYDPEDLGEIQVWGPDDRDPVSVLALDLDYAKGLSAKQNEMIRSLLREQGAASENKPALQRARNDLIQAVEKLMVSRKQRDRRKSGAIRGMSSNHPDRDLKQISPIEAPPIKKVRSIPVSDAERSSLPLLLPAFQLRSRKGGDHE